MYSAPQTQNPLALVRSARSYHSFVPDPDRRSSRRSDVRASSHGIHSPDLEFIRSFEVRLHRVLVQTFRLVVQRYRCGPDE